MDQRRVGVEEELLLVDPGTGQPRAVSRAVLRRAGLVHPQTGRPVPAEVAVEALLQHVTPVLAESTELATVRELGPANRCHPLPQHRIGSAGTAPCRRSRCYTLTARRERR